MRTHQAARRAAPVARAEPKGAERAPSQPRPMRADAALADRQVQPPMHQFASLALERPSLAVTPPPNRTGLPDRLKAGIEHLSGFAMDDVRVHYNSSKPATVQALAYTRGNEIHVGPGQEKHLPHEAWHVVQQAQGRVKPTLQMKGAAINDDAALEREAEAAGRQAVVRQARLVERISARADQGQAASPPKATASVGTVSAVAPVIQRFWFNRGGTVVWEDDAKLDNSYVQTNNIQKAKWKHPQGPVYQKAGADIKSKAPTSVEITKAQVTANADAEKEKRISLMLGLKKHLAGEKDGETAVKGGHLLTEMTATWGTKLYVAGNEASAKPWWCKWGLLTADGAKKPAKNRTKADLATPSPKESSMFPSAWTWNNLEEQIKGHTYLNQKIILKDGIEIDTIGVGTFFPIVAKQTDAKDEKSDEKQ